MAFICLEPLWECCLALKLWYTMTPQSFVLHIRYMNLLFKVGCTVWQWLLPLMNAQIKMVGL